MKKKYVLKKWVKNAIEIILAIVIIVIILALDGLTLEQKETINYCMNQGNSRTICERGLLGY